MASFSSSWQKTTNCDIGNREVAQQIARIGPDASVTYRSGVEPYSHAASKAPALTVLCALNIYPTTTEILTEDTAYGLAPLGKEVIR